MGADMRTGRRGRCPGTPRPRWRCTRRRSRGLGAGRSNATGGGGAPGGTPPRGGLAAAVDEDVAGLEVAVDDAVLVEGLDGVGDFGEEFDALAAVQGNVGCGMWDVGCECGSGTARFSGGSRCVAGFVCDRPALVF